MGGRFPGRSRSSRRSIAGYVTETRPDYDGNLTDKGDGRCFSASNVKNVDIVDYPRTRKREWILPFVSVA